MDNSVKDQLPTAEEPTPQVIPLSRLETLATVGVAHFIKLYNNNYYCIIL